MNRVARTALAVLLGGAAFVGVAGTSAAIGAPLAALLVVVAVWLASREAPRAPLPEPGPADLEPDEALAFLIAPLPEGVVLFDAERQVIATNQAAANIVGRSLESMSGVSLIQALRDHDLAEVTRAAAGTPTPVRVSATGHDVVATATSVGTGRVRTMLHLADVTELERARRARADLVANLSHELRTPIAAARALAETLQSGVEEEDDRQHFIDRLVVEIERLAAMVERLLRLSRLESGSEALHIEPFAPIEALRTAVARVEPIADAQGISLVIAPGEAPPVLGDRERVLEVLANLLDNAFKHTPEDSTVRLAAQSEGDTVRFEVSDEGPGILPSDRERVFERFYTADRARTTSAGTGLGLSIARHIIDRLGGRIWVDDRTPGATLCFTLPIAPAPAASEASGGAPEA